MKNSPNKDHRRSRRWGKRFLGAFVVFVALAAVLVTAVLLAAESDSGRQWLTRQASDRLDRQVALSDIDIDYGSVTAIRLTNLSIENPDWAEKPLMLTLDRLLLRLRLLPLLRGQLVFERIAADNPQVNLQRQADGHSSWQFGNGPAKPAADESGPLTLPRIESLQLNGGFLNYNDVPLETELALQFGSETDTSSQAGNDALGGPNALTANGELLLSGRRLQIDLRAGSPTRALNSTDAGITYPAELHINGDTLDLRLNGTVDALLQPNKAKLEFSLEGSDLQRWNDTALLRADTPLLPAISQYSATAALRAEYGSWHVDYLQLEADGNRLEGQLHADSDKKPLALTAKFRAGPIDVARIQSWLPESGPSQPLDQQLAARLQKLAELKLQADVQITATNVTIDPRRIDELQLDATLKNGRLTVEQLAVEAAGSSVVAEGFVDSRSKPAKGNIKLTFDGLRPQQIAAETDNAVAVPEPLNGRLRGELEAEFTARRVTTNAAATNADSATISATPAADFNAATGPEKLQLVRLNAPPSTLRFRDLDNDSDVTFKLEISKLDVRRDTPTKASLDGTGRWRGERFKTRVNLSELPTLQAIQAMFTGSTAPTAPVELAVTAELGRSILKVDGELNSAWPPLPNNLDVVIESPDPAEAAAAFDVAMGTIEPLSVRAQLNQTKARQWLMLLTNATIGSSDLNGEARFGLRDDGGINLQAEFNSQRFGIASVKSQRADEAKKPAAAAPGEYESNAESTAAFVAPTWLQNMDGRLQLNIRELALPRLQLGELESVVLFERGTIQLQPLKFPLGGGSINATGKIDVTVAGLAGELDADIRTVSVGDVVEQFSAANANDDAASLGTLDGRVELRLAEASNQQEPVLTLDGISERLRIQQVRLQYDDPNIGASTNLRIRADSLNSGLTVDGIINYRDRPVQLTLNTGSLRQAIDASKSLAIDATLVNQDTSVILDGTVGSLLPIEQLHAKVELRGPGTADLGEWLDIPMPDLPPYDLRARVKLSQTAAGLDRVDLSNLKGTVGDSDLEGELTITVGGTKPDIQAKLRSNLLDFDDLAGLIGGAPDPDETASAEQQRQAENKAHSEKLLPNMPLNLSALQQVNADVEYRAKKVLAPNLPLDTFALDMTLRDGQLKMPRLNFGLAGGTATLQLELDANETPASSKLNGDFDDIRLNDLLEKVASANDAAGTVGGSITLWMKGDSIGEWLGSADGGSYLTMNGGQIDALLIELAGLDIGESLALFFSSETEVAIECSYVDLQARNGVVTLKPILLDTSDTHFIGEGSIDLSKETMHITINPYPKDFTLLSARGPLKIGGTLKNPEFGVRPSIPLPELGLSEGSARCDSLVTELRNAREANRDDE